MLYDCEEKRIIIVHHREGCSERIKLNFNIFHFHLYFPLYSRSVEIIQIGHLKKVISVRLKRAAEGSNMSDCGFVHLCYQQSLVSGPYVILACTVMPAGTVK